MFTLTIDYFPTKGITESWMSRESKLHFIGVWLLNMFHNKGVGFMRCIEFNNRIEYDGYKLFDDEQTYVSLDVTFNNLYDTIVANNIKKVCVSSNEKYYFNKIYYLTVDFGKGGNKGLHLRRTPPLQVYSSTLLSNSELVYRCAILAEDVNKNSLSFDIHSKKLNSMSEEISSLTLQLKQEKKLHSVLATNYLNLVDKIERLMEKNEAQITQLSLLQRQVNDLVDKTNI